MKILVVDDNAWFAEALAEGVQRQGHEPRVAHGARAGLLALDEPFLDAVFLDADMTDPDAIEMLRRIRSACPWLPVILFASYPLPHELAESVRLGLTEIVEKPSVLATLSQSLARCPGMRSHAERVGHGRRRSRELGTSRSRGRPTHGASGGPPCESSFLRRRGP